MDNYIGLSCAYSGNMSVYVSTRVRESTFILQEYTVQ